MATPSPSCSEFSAHTATFLEVLMDVCERANLSASRVFGVATFCEQFRLQAQGRHVIRCCRGTACHVRGAQAITRALVRELGVKEGGTTPDGRFAFETVACLGTCFLAPVIMVDGDYHGKVAPAKLSAILERYE